MIGRMAVAGLVAGIVGWLLACTPLAAQEPREILDAWLEHQATLETWSADVVQTRELAALSRPLEARGKVWFRQPNRFRWQLGDPPRTIAVRERDELVVVYPQLEQAERYALGGGMDPAWRQALALLEVGFPRDAEGFYAQYRPVSVETEDDRWSVTVEPVAKQALRLIERVRFEVARADFTLLATELHFPGGSVMRNEFSNHRANPELDDALFEAPVEPGYTVSTPLADRAP